MKSSTIPIRSRYARAALGRLQLGLLLCGGAWAGCGDAATPAPAVDAGTSDAAQGGGAGHSGAGGSTGTGAKGGASAGTGGAGGSAGAGTGGSGGSAGEDASDAGADDAGMTSEAQAKSPFGFFVTSDTSMTGKLGGLAGADKRCQDLAAAVGAGDKTWHAYLSVEHSDANGGGPVHARDRIGQGPWYNAKGGLVAPDLTALHAIYGDPNVFLDEHGNKINGQWLGSPAPNQHDILTGSQADGSVLVGKTCKDWTSDAMQDVARVGHSDGLGPERSAQAPYNSWNSVHDNAGCNDTAPKGGAGKLYCFAID